MSGNAGAVVSNEYGRIPMGVEQFFLDLNN